MHAYIATGHGGILYFERLGNDTGTDAPDRQAPGEGVTVEIGDAGAVARSALVRRPGRNGDGGGCR